MRACAKLNTPFLLATRLDSHAMETVASEQAATLNAEATRLAELVAVVKRLAEAKPCDSSALRSALVALIDSGLSDRTLNDGERLLNPALYAVLLHSSRAHVVYAARLHVDAALSRAEANLDTGYAACISLGGGFANLVALMRSDRGHNLLSVQTDSLFALADYLSLSAELARVGARDGAFAAVRMALRRHGAALVSAAEPVLNRVTLSATTFISARHVTEREDFVATVDCASA